jgi:hypothetical protein
MAKLDQVLTRRHIERCPGFRRDGGSDGATMRGA